MCLGVLGRLVELPLNGSDVGRADVDGVIRDVNLGLLAHESLVVGDWVLVHLGFALDRLTEADVVESRATREILTSLPGAS